jgi:4-alpha-glucanotransferase
MFEAKERSAGALLHITSLPGPGGSGDLGPSAYEFASFLSTAGLRHWQILPLNPVEKKYRFSPYQSPSAFAGNPLLISPGLLVEEGFLSKRDVTEKGGTAATADFPLAQRIRSGFLTKACGIHGGDRSFHEFQERESYWLRDFALFQALRSHLNKPWHRWPKTLRNREPAALEEAERDLAVPVNREKFAQYVFFRQWGRLRDHLRERDIRLIGDCPIYVPHQSADVWANAHLFQLDEGKRPAFVSGVPPDAFSRKGQLWGHPLYDWERMKEDGYGWWLHRLAHLGGLVDAIRLDHFRGLVSYWRVPGRAKTAVRGRWIPAPAEDFLSSLREKLPHLSLIAEDLGSISPDVIEVMDRFNLPGMKILLFAFDNRDRNNPYLPHTYGPGSVVYTGTHDNNTVRGWYDHEASREAKERLRDYVRSAVTSANVHTVLIRLAFASPSQLAVVPMQDFLGLGQEARMNRPATQGNNWIWRLYPGELTGGLSERIAALCRETQRI